MEENNVQTECPSIIFKIKNTLYTINSSEVQMIMQFENCQPIPQSSSWMKGIVKYDNDVVPVFELRTIFGLPTLDDEYSEFANMIDSRKQDHIEWAEELESSMNENREFKLTTDPHKCKFGIWYDKFESEFNAVNFHFNKINKPHQRLHAAAEEAMRCSKTCESCQRSECLKDVLRRVKNEYVPTVVGLLDESKEIIKTQYRTMLLIIAYKGRNYAFTVDEVLSVEELENTKSESGDIFLFKHTPVVGVRKSKQYDKIILEIDYKTILDNIVKTDDAANFVGFEGRAAEE